MARFAVSQTQLNKLLDESPKLEKLLHKVSERIVENAIAIFTSSSKWDNENRVSNWTPPKYISSFRLEKRQRAYRVVNDDPGWYVVEFGAHSHERENVPKMRPLGRAFDQAIAEGLT